MSTAQAPFNMFAHHAVSSQPSPFVAHQLPTSNVLASPSPFSLPPTPLSPFHLRAVASPAPTPPASSASLIISPMQLNFGTPDAVHDSRLSPIIGTFNSSISETSSIDTVGHAPSVRDMRGSAGTPHSESTASAGSNHEKTKMMKAASMVSQFYTTIVIKVCLYVRENWPVVSLYRRACIIFNRVERALRDRSLYPLPDGVSPKDLLTFSFFKGPEAEGEFAKYCESDVTPLLQEMTDFATRLYSNKFTDAKKIIANHVLPKYLSIVKDLTGNGKKSGQAQYSICC